MTQGGGGQEKTPHSLGEPLGFTAVGDDAGLGLHRIAGVVHGAIDVGEQQAYVATLAHHAWGAASD